MLEPSEINELIEIADKAVSEMGSRGYEEFLLSSISWDDDSDYWVVRFYCERGNIENVGVAVRRHLSGYETKGLVFD